MGPTVCLKLIEALVEWVELLMEWIKLLVLWVDSWVESTVGRIVSGMG